MKKTAVRWLASGVLMALVAACGTPMNNPDASGDAMVNSEASMNGDAAMGSDSGGSDAAGEGGTAMCGPLETDYQPRSAMMSHATWPACRSDNNMFQPFTPDEITSIARATDFELLNANPNPVTDMMGMQIAPAHPMPLFDATRDPSMDEFRAAAAYYASNSVMSGLVERFARRPDEHYPQPAGAVVNAMTGEYDDHWCNTEANWMSARDYCVGPASLRPVMNAALAAGAMGGMGTPNRVHAARMEASLLWLMYASVYKESLSCLQDVADCDSSWGYYTVGNQRNAAMQKTLARYVQAIEPETHQRIWDALLAVHCWRELDGGLMAMPPVAANRVMRERARDQLDRALNRGMYAIVAARLRAYAQATSAGNMQVAAAHAGFIGVVAPLIARALETWVPTKYAATVNVAGMANVTAAITALRGATLSAADATRTADTLLAIFPCP